MKRTDGQTSVKAVKRQRLTLIWCKSNAEVSREIFETQKTLLSPMELHE